MDSTDPRRRRACVVPEFDSKSANHFLSLMNTRPHDRLPLVAPDVEAFLAALREWPEAVVMPAELENYGLTVESIASPELIDAIIRRLFIDAECRRLLRLALSDRRFRSHNRRAGE